MPDDTNPRPQMNFAPELTMEERFQLLSEDLEDIKVDLDIMVRAMRILLLEKGLNAEWNNLAQFLSNRRRNLV